MVLARAVLDAFGARDKTLSEWVATPAARGLRVLRDFGSGMK